MLRTIETKKEATQEWVNGFNAIPQELIVKAYKNNIDDVYEITPITKGDQAWSNEYQGVFNVESINIDDDTVIIDVDGEEKTVAKDDLSHEYDDFFPMWGTMWTFGETCDEEWTKEHLQEMAKCGFRIFESDELGVFFGIDGAGYDFYEAHWIPLYTARGLQWHDNK